MNTKIFFPALISLCLALSGCTLFQPVTHDDAPGPANPVQPQGSVAATRTPRPTATPVPTIVLTPTPTLTPTADPKVFNPGNFGDSLQLGSFEMKVVNDTSGSGGWLENAEYEYNRTPLSIHEKGQDANGPIEVWQINTWKYLYRDHWLAMPFHADKDLNKEGIFRELDMRNLQYLDLFSSATFTGQETYQGLPVYHFSFDAFNLAPLKNGWKVDTAQGKLLVSVDGNIPLYYQLMVKGDIQAEVNPNGGVDFLPGKITITKALSNINQPVKIALPASYPNLDVEPSFPLPSGTGLDHLDLVGKGSQYYFYVTQASKEDFLLFYQNLALTNEWTVERFGPLQGSSYNCEACVILSNGKEKVRIVWNQDFHQTYILVFNPPE